MRDEEAIAECAYDILRTAAVQDNPAPGVSSGQALQAIHVAARTLPSPYAGERTDSALQETRAAGKVRPP